MNNSKCKRLRNNCPKSLVLKVSFLFCNKKLGLRTRAITVELIIIIIIIIIIISRIIIATTQ